MYFGVILAFVVVLLVLAIAATLRLFALSNIPSSFDWDEASTAYNAYSVLKTGKDEFGQNFPILFRAYDAYVPPLLVYLNIPSIFLFGLNEFGGRLPNALLGVLAVWGFYLLVKELFGNRKLALLCALFLAISPWHIKYTRVDFFASLPVVFIVFGTYFFVKAVKGRKRKTVLLVISCICFVLSIFSYYSAYVFVPLFAIFLCFLYRRNLNIKTVFLFLLPLVFAAVLLLKILPGGNMRFTGVTYLSDPELIEQEAADASSEGLLGKITHNRRIIYLQRSLDGYFKHFQFDFLFGKADSVGRMVVPGSGFGLLYLWDLPFLIAGAYFALRNRQKGTLLFLGFLSLAPFPASFALPQPASTRVFIIVPALVFLSAYGFWNLTRLRFKVVTLFLLLLLTFNFYLFAHQYFMHFPKAKSAAWFWGYKELFNFLNSQEWKSSKVHFAFSYGDDNLNQSHIFTLFYNKVDPAMYQSAGGTRLGCQGTAGHFSFGRYSFVPYNCPKEKYDLAQIGSGDLIVTARELDVRRNLKVVNNMDGTGAFFVYKKGDVEKQLLEYTRY